MILVFLKTLVMALVSLPQLANLAQSGFPRWVRVCCNCVCVGGLVCCTRCYAEFVVSCYLHFVFCQGVGGSCPIYCTRSVPQLACVPRAGMSRSE